MGPRASDRARIAAARVSRPGCGSGSSSAPSAGTHRRRSSDPSAGTRRRRSSAQAARPHRCVSLQEHSLEEIIAHSAYGLE